jgi:hypothetical protein
VPKSYTVFPTCDFPSLCHYIAHFTNTSFQEVFTKPHISYLQSYLGEQGLQARTAICEHEYIEKSYLDDYSEYFVKCFHDYGRKSARFHFFECSLKDRNIEEILDCNDKNKRSSLIERINKSYLGFVVIRPIPRTFISRTCLRAYSKDEDDPENTIQIKRDIKSNLFGIDFTVSTLPFQEQDKVVAACATASLWSFLQAPSLAGC